MSSLQLLLAAFCLPTLVVSSAQECKEAYKKRPTHTACLKPNEDCTIHNRTVSAADRELILKAHNDYRSQVANGQLQGYPPASDMFELVWDDEMAGVAQAWADQCIKLGETLDHDKVKDRFTTKFKTTGQNLAWDAFNEPLTPKWAARIKSWFDEYPEYDPLYIDRFEERGKLKKFGHFTQVVWAKSRAIGCGYAHYSVPGAERRYEQVYVCNYGPAGNLLGRAIYLQGGQPCGNCSNGTVCDNTTGLCAPPKAPSPAATTESTTTTENTTTTERTARALPPSRKSPPPNFPPAPKRKPDSSVVISTLPWLNLTAVLGAIVAKFYFSILHYG